MEERLDNIINGVKKIQEMHQNALKRILDLEQKNAELEAQLSACKERKVELAESKLVGGIAMAKASSEAEKKQMKLKINELVREVDKCIALLNQ